MPLATTLRSIVESNASSWPLEFHLLSDGFSEDTRKRVFDSLPKGSASLRWLSVDMTPFREFETCSYISKMTYARFLIPNIFPDIVSRVLYLDADLLVLDDLGPLWEIDLAGVVVGAVLDNLDSQIKGNKPGVEGVPRVRDYFNAGVLLVNLEKWREERISEKALDYLVKNPKSPFSDQDALNVACDSLWKQLDPRWNFQEHYKNRIAELDPEHRPAIIHFVRNLKPWNASVISLNTSFYDAFRSRTCFARTYRDKLLDMVLRTWSRLKGVLKRYWVMQATWSAVRSLRVRGR